MTVTEKIEALRKLMTEWGWDAAIISGSDPHNSEYAPQRWQQRQWISGFTGSAGTVVVTGDHAGLWTDSRYFIQAEQELAGTGIALHKLRVPDAEDYPEWLSHHLPQGACVGIDGQCLSVDEVNNLLHALPDGKRCRVVSKLDFLDSIWEDRPSLPSGKVFLLDDKYAGRSRADKLAWLRESIGPNTMMLLGSLDQIAWMLNLRCDDVRYNPVAISYLLVESRRATLFIAPEKVDNATAQTLMNDSVYIQPYCAIEDYLHTLNGQGNVTVDKSSINYHLYNILEQQLHESVQPMPSAVTLAKSIKNRTEIEGERRAYLLDGVALTRFFHWLEQQLSDGKPVAEVDAAAKLSALRAENCGAMGDSFECISAYGSNAALPHYEPTPEMQSIIEPHGLYLNDSGGQYLFGTTDTTRTVAMGRCSDIEREDYTLVLMGMIDLSRAIFPVGTRGANIDALARYPLWLRGRNYGHGTGHGIGFFLNVHEGPQDLRQNCKDQPLLHGMITSVEPGLYREGMHGIRHENVVLVSSADETQFGQWLKFETLTRCWIDTAAIDTNLMNQEQIDWLNDYNALVYSAQKDLLSDDDARWLEAKCQPIAKAQTAKLHKTI